MSTTEHSIRDGIARAITATGLAGIGLIHLLDAPGKFSETPYMGYMYVGLIAGCLAVAFALVQRSSPLAWGAAIVLAGSAVIGFTLTRTVGLPQATGDIGNWGEPLGMASLFVEGSVIALAASRLLAGAPEGAAVAAPARSRSAGAARGRAHERVTA